MITVNDSTILKSRPGRNEANNRKHSKVIASFALLLCITFNACNKSNPELYGIYKFYSEDRIAMQLMAGQNTYIQLNENKTIIYHTEINGKKTFHREGVFILNKKTNMLKIDWSSGKIPNELTIEEQDHSYIIKIGSTVYKKQKKNK